jgi:hypothetical protein
MEIDSIVFSNIEEEKTSFESNFARKELGGILKELVIRSTPNQSEIYSDGNINELLSKTMNEVANSAFNNKENDESSFIGSIKETVDKYCSMEADYRENYVLYKIRNNEWDYSTEDGREKIFNVFKKQGFSSKEIGEDYKRKLNFALSLEADDIIVEIGKEVGADLVSAEEKNGIIKQTIAVIKEEKDKVKEEFEDEETDEKTPSNGEDGTGDVSADNTPSDNEDEEIGMDGEEEVEGGEEEENIAEDEEVDDSGDESEEEEEFSEEDFAFLDGGGSVDEYKPSLNVEASLDVTDTNVNSEDIEEFRETESSEIRNEVTSIEDLLEANLNKEVIAEITSSDVEEVATNADSEKDIRENNPIKGDNVDNIPDITTTEVVDEENTPEFSELHTGSESYKKIKLHNDRKFSKMNIVTTLYPLSPTKLDNLHLPSIKALANVLTKSEEDLEDIIPARFDSMKYNILPIEKDENLNNKVEEYRKISMEALELSNLYKSKLYNVGFTPRKIIDKDNPLSIYLGKRVKELLDPSYDYGFESYTVKGTAKIDGATVYIEYNSDKKPSAKAKEKMDKVYKTHTKLFKELGSKINSKLLEYYNNNLKTNPYGKGNTKYPKPIVSNIFELSAGWISSNNTENSSWFYRITSDYSSKNITDVVVTISTSKSISVRKTDINWGGRRLKAKKANSKGTESLVLIHEDPQTNYESLEDAIDASLDISKLKKMYKKTKKPYLIDDIEGREGILYENIASLPEEHKAEIVKVMEFSELDIDSNILIDEEFLTNLSLAVDSTQVRMDKATDTDEALYEKAKEKIESQLVRSLTNDEDQLVAALCSSKDSVDYVPSIHEKILIKLGKEQIKNDELGVEGLSFASDIRRKGLALTSVYHTIKKLDILNKEDFKEFEDYITTEEK